MLTAYTNRLAGSRGRGEQSRTHGGDAVTFLGWLAFWITFAFVDHIVGVVLEYLGYNMKSSGAQMGSYCITAVLTTAIACCSVAAWEKLTAKNDDPDDRAGE
jgi:hypothetical protein